MRRSDSRCSLDVSPAVLWAVKRARMAACAHSRPVLYTSPHAFPQKNVDGALPPLPQMHTLRLPPPPNTMQTERFLAWKRKFDAEVAAARAAAAESSSKGAANVAEAMALKLSGKQWFLKQHADGDEGVDDGSAISEGSDADGLSDYEPGQARSQQGEEGEEELEYSDEHEDEDDEDFLDDYLAGKEE